MDFDKSVDKNEDYTGCISSPGQENRKNPPEVEDFSKEKEENFDFGIL